MSPPARIRVCHMVTSLRLGGAERVVVDLATGLDPSRFEVAVATTRGGGPFEEHLRAAGIPVRAFDVSGTQAPLELARVVAFLRGRFDVLHAHPGTVARAAAVLAGVPIRVSTLHNIYEWKHPAWKASERVLNAFTQRHVAVSDAVRESALDVYGLAPQDVVTVYNGIDTSAFTPPSPERRAAVRRALGIEDERFVVLGACHLDPHKRPELLVRAIAKRRVEGSSATLLLAGDGPMRAQLEQLARELGVADAVRLLGRRRDMPDVYAAADVFAHAAVREGLGLVLLEAMATGVPVVAARAAAVANVVEHEANGLLAPLDDADALAAGLARVEHEPGLRARLVAEGRRRAVERFGVARMVSDYAAIYEKLAARGGVRAVS